MRAQSGRKKINRASWTDDRTFEPNVSLVQEDGDISIPTI